MSSLPKEQRDIIEADSFWCLSKFLDGIQDNYIFAQLGIQHKVNQLKELIQRIDGKNCIKQGSKPFLLNLIGPPILILILFTILILKLREAV